MHNELLDAVLKYSFLRGRFQLASGGWSDTYLDLRRTTLASDGLAAVCAALWPALEAARVTAVGGPTLGADPIVAGILMEAQRRGRPLQGFLVRSGAKDHGTGRLIEGHCPAGARVAVLDDVVTRGGSIVRAIEAVRAAGAEVALALAIVDREQGGPAILEGMGVRLVAPLRLSEVLAAAAARGI